MKLEVRDIIELKGQRQLVELNVASVEQAQAAEAAGIDMIVSGNLANRAAYRAAAPQTHFTFGLKYGGPINADQAKREAFDALEAGADDVSSNEDEHEIWTAMDALHEVAKALESKLGEADSAKLAWKPTTTVEVDESNAGTLMKLVDTLEDDDDVQTVWGNYEVSDEVMEKLG